VKTQRGAEEEEEEEEEGEEGEEEEAEVETAVIYTAGCVNYLTHLHHLGAG